MICEMGKDYKIIIIDEQQAFTEVLKTILEEARVCCMYKEYTDIEDAVDYFIYVENEMKQSRPDLVFMNASMTGSTRALSHFSKSGWEKVSFLIYYTNNELERLVRSTHICHMPIPENMETAKVMLSGVMRYWAKNNCFPVISD